MSFISVVVIITCISLFKYFIILFLFLISISEKTSSKSRNNIELELIKIILVNFVNDIDQGINKTPIQKQNAYELYDRYTTLGGNSYVHDRWMKLKDEGKL